MYYFKFFLLFSLLSMTSFGFKLAPDFFDKRVDGKGSSQEITFWNDSTETVRYRVYVESSEEKNFDMAKWVEIYPQIITLKPKSTGKVRLFAKAPQEQPIGEYQFYFGIRTLSLPKTNSESQESQISLPINLKIKMYGYNGEIPQDVALKNYHFVKEGDEIKFKGNFINDTKNISIKSKIILSGKGMTESFRTGRIKEGTFDFDIPLQKFKNPNNIEEILILDEMTNKRIQRIKLK